MSVAPAIWITEAKLLGPRSRSQSGQHRSPVSKKGAKPEDIVESEHMSITHTPWVWSPTQHTQIGNRLRCTRRPGDQLSISGHCDRSKSPVCHVCHTVHTREAWRKAPVILCNSSEPSCHYLDTHILWKMIWIWIFTSSAMENWYSPLLASEIYLPLYPECRN